ncbi:MAG TPA: mannose-6-phosphate isomerase, class I [Chitinophagaceae bacterium]|nr:mannose-6-phosphate isomerase, class I [Chitinophagaceae bacterium]
MNHKALYRLTGQIQHYRWGGYDFIPQLLHIVNAGHQSFAEYWLGAHDNAPAQIIPGNIPLNIYLQEHLQENGAAGISKRLPYLLKVLDVRDMLSIQVHPSKQAAAVEFERENAGGIPLTASHRNYKDDNHKPELMVALSDFWLLHGFKPVEEIIEIIETVPEFAFMLPLLKEGGYKQLYSKLMQMEQEEINRILQPLLERIVAAYDCDYLPKESPHFWAARAALTFNEPDKTDRGIFSIYLLNLVHLDIGEAIFQDAGVLHAYLEGQNIEIMANSDNVLRGGLTPKHIDVNELMKHVTFEAVTPRVIQATDAGNGEQVFASPAPDFRLSRFVLKKEQKLAIATSSTEIYLLLEGAVTLKQGDTTLELNTGDAAVSFGNSGLEMAALSPAILYRACSGGI